MDKTKVLEMIQTEHTALETLIASLSETQLYAAALEGQRSAKDILVHAAAWERLCIDWIEIGRQGRTPERNETVDQFNERIFLENQKCSLQEAMTEFYTAYQRLLAQVQTLSKEELSAPHHFIWSGGDGSLSWFIEENSYGHYREHAQQIRRCLGIDEAGQ